MKTTLAACTAKTISRTRLGQHGAPRASPAERRTSPGGVALRRGHGGRHAIGTGALRLPCGRWPTPHPPAHPPPSEAWPVRRLGQRGSGLGTQRIALARVTACARVAHWPAAGTIRAAGAFGRFHGERVRCVRPPPPSPNRTLRVHPSCSRPRQRATALRLRLHRRRLERPRAPARPPPEALLLASEKQRLPPVRRRSLMILGWMAVQVRQLARAGQDNGTPRGHAHGSPR